MICLVVIKSVRACNLRCPYCYYINEDTPQYGSFISEATLRRFYRAIAEYIGPEDQFEFVWHGGEPLILGKERFRRFVQLQMEYLTPSQVFNVVQTNGTLLDGAWIDLFEELAVGVGVSLDGPKEIHDRRRPTVKGGSSYEEAVRGVRLLQDRGHSVGVLSVVDPLANGAEVLRHLRDLGVASCDLLIPVTNHCVEKDPAFRTDHESSAGIAAYLLDAFEEWMEGGVDTISVELFDALIKNAVGFPHGNLNAGALNFAENLILETDGALCLDPDFWYIDRFRHGEKYELAVSVHDPDFRLDEVERRLNVFAEVHGLRKLPTPCQPCSMRSICRASHPASRFHPDGTFDHRSAYCEPMFELSTRVVEYLCERGLHDRLIDADLRRALATPA